MMQRNVELFTQFSELNKPSGFRRQIHSYIAFCMHSDHMVWYGMVWYGMVWYGMVWYGMVWYGMVWYGMV